MTQFFATQDPIYHEVTFTYIFRGLQDRSAIDQVIWWWVWHQIDEAEYSEVHNLDKEYSEGGAVSPGGTSSIRDQGEASSHTGFDLFYITDPLIQVPDWQ